jgi:hypothetical protein
MSFSIEVRGVNRVRNSLRKLIALDKTILEPEFRRWAQGVRKLLKSKPYPAKRAGQTYKRTGRLANSWAVEPKGTGVWSVTNRADYAGWVVGDKQSWFHKDRWWQARPTVEEQIPELTQAITEKIKGTWESG